MPKSSNKLTTGQLGRLICEIRSEPEFRCPADGERVTEEEAKNAVAVAAKVREAARAQLPAGALTHG